MLILTRRSGQTIFIGDEVRLTVLGIKGDQVRIGIEAPDAVAVHREEIYDRIQAEAAGDRGSPKYNGRGSVRSSVPVFQPPQWCR